MKRLVTKRMLVVLPVLAAAFAVAAAAQPPRSASARLWKPPSRT